jgi:hypothetical protein
MPSTAAEITENPNSWWHERILQICWRKLKFPQIKERNKEKYTNIYHRKDGSLSEFRILRDMGYGTERKQFAL